MTNLTLLYIRRYSRKNVYAVYAYIPCHMTPPNSNLLFWHVHAIFNCPSVKCIFHLCWSENESTNKMRRQFWMFLFRARTVSNCSRWNGCVPCKGFPPSPSEDGWKKAHGRKIKALVVADLHLRTQYGRVNFAKGMPSESPQAQKKACSNADHVVYACLCCNFLCGVFNCIFTLVSCLMRKWMIQIANKTLPAYTCISKETNMSCTQTKYEETPAKLERLSCNYLNLNMYI